MSKSKVAVKLDDQILTAVNWLRDAKRSGVATREAVQYERRVEFFKGAKMLDALVGDKYKALKSVPVLRSRDEAKVLCGQMMKQQMFHRSQKIFISARRWELEMHPSHEIEEDGLYTWIHEGSQRRLYLLCALTLLGALVLCMVQIWPIWMKIGLWWCSVTFLTTFGALAAVRLCLFCVMFAVGFRGIWLFPNLFDDNQTFAGSFMPIMGKAEPVNSADEYDSDDDDIRRVRSKKKGDADGTADGADGAPASPAKKGGGGGGKRASSSSRDGDEDPTWKFGLANAAILGVIGMIACWNMGFFDGDNVPDFVAKHNDLQFYFPTLAAPEAPNATAAAEAAANGEPAEDPFAAPSDEDVHY